MSSRFDASSDPRIVRIDGCPAVLLFLLFAPSLPPAEDHRLRRARPLWRQPGLRRRSRTFRLLGEAPANGLAERLTHRQAAIVLVAALDDHPGRLARCWCCGWPVRPQHEPLVHLPVLPVDLRDAPPCQGVLLQRLEPPALSLLVEMHPELADERPIVGQRPFELDDARELVLESDRPDAPMSAIEHARVPGPEEQADPAARRQLPPERQYSGRSRSSSDGTPNARVRIHRGSIHALSRLTVSPFPAPSTPAKTTMTGNDAPRSCCCSSRSRVRSFGAAACIPPSIRCRPSSAVSMKLGQRLSCRSRMRAEPDVTRPAAGKSRRRP